MKREDEESALKNNICIGSPATALDTCPSIFDMVFSCGKETHICVGHQVGDELNDEVYLAIYDVGGAKSLYHCFARIAINKL